MEFKGKKFRIEKINFKNKAKDFLGLTTIYTLNYDGKVIFLGYKYDISSQFRKILEYFYGSRWLVDYPDNYFKDYIHKAYQKATEKNRKTYILKKSYYTQRAIEQRKNKIKRLEEEIAKLKRINENGTNKTN